jgi:hypothetical protein
MKAAYAAEDFYKYFLREIGSVGPVLHCAGQEGKNGLVIAGNQPRKRLFGAGLQFRNEGRLFGLERQRAGHVAHGEIRLQFLPSHLTAIHADLASALCLLPGSIANAVSGSICLNPLQFSRCNRENASGIPRETGLALVGDRLSRHPIPL